MIYIKKVELHNFQSHQHTEMEFDRGLNVILGNSDVGKTAILRAIKWCLYNEPKGDYFIRQGEREVSVKVTFSNDVIVQRAKTPSKNSYFLVDSAGNEMRFEGFGIDVPKEITDVTNMYKVSLDNSNNKTILNIAEQLDGPFLLNEQASLRASAIGRLIGVNYVDDALRTVVRDNKRTNQEIAELIKNKEELKEQLDKFSYVKDYKEKFDKISKIRSEIGKLQDKLELCSSLKENFDKNRIELEEVTNLVNKFSSLSEFEIIIPKLENFVLKKNTFENYLVKISKTNEEINLMENNLSKLKYLDDLSKITSKIYDDKNTLSSYETLYNKYLKNTNELSEVKNNFKNYKNNDELLKIIEKLESTSSLYSELTKFKNNLDTVNSKIAFGNDYIKNFDRIDKIDFISNTVENKSAQLKNVLEIKNRFTEVFSKVKDLKIEIENITVKVKENTASYEKTILDMGVCPFCYSEIDDNSMEHIKYHLRND